MNNRPKIKNEKCKFQKKYKNIQKQGYRPPTDMLTSGNFMIFSD